MTIDLSHLRLRRRHVEAARICGTAGGGVIGRIITDQLDGYSRVESLERLSRWAAKGTR